MQRDPLARVPRSRKRKKEQGSASLTVLNDAVDRRAGGSRVSGPPFTLLVLCAVPLGVSWLLTALLIRWAPRLGLIDHPDPRKVHRRPTPRAGGLAIVAGVAAGVGLLPLVGPREALADPRWLFGPVIVALGLADDWRPLPWWLRLGVQAAVTALAVFTCVPAGGAGLP